MQRLPSELKYNYCFYYIALQCSVRFSRSFVGQRKGVRVHFGGRPIASGDNTADDNNNSCTPLLCWWWATVTAAVRRVNLIAIYWIDVNLDQDCEQEPSARFFYCCSDTINFPTLRRRECKVFVVCCWPVFLHPPTKAIHNDGHGWGSGYRNGINWVCRRSFEHRIRHRDGQYARGFGHGDGGRKVKNGTELIASELSTSD